MTKRVRHTVVLVLLAVSPVLGQSTATLRGFVSDEADHQPLVGTNVVLITADSTLFGAITNADGFFSITNVPAGSLTLRVSFVGYQTFQSKVTFAEGEIVRRDVMLKVWNESFDEVVVSGERGETGGTLKSAGVQAVKPADIERIPLPGLSPDLASYLVQLPGIVSGGDRGGLLFIRGGSPAENGVFIDGMLVYQPFHILGFYSAFPSDLVSQADVYAGGFGSEFGGRISAIIDVSARTGNKTGFASSASVSPFIAAARLEGPVVPGSVSFLASVRRSLVDEIGGDVIGEPLPYRFDDAFGKVHANLSPSIQAAITGISSNDRGIFAPLGSNDALGGQSNEISWSNRAAGARLLVLPATMPVLAEFLISYSHFNNSFGPAPNPIRTSEIQRAGGIVNATYFARTLDFKFGFSASTVTLNNQLGGQFQQLDDEQQYLTEGWAYLETEFKSIPDIRLTTGLRIHSYPSVSHSSIEPRARVVWKRGNHQLSAATGLYSQEITGVTDRRDPADIFTAWVPAEDIGKAPTAIHVIAGYRYMAGRGLTLSAEGFYKRLSDLLIPEWTAFPRLTTNLHPADGNVTGMDLRVEFDWKNVYAFVGYGYTRVIYETREPAVQYWYGTQSVTFSPSHDRRHQITTSGQANVLGFDVSALWQFGSGTPFTQALGFDEYIMLEDTYEGVDLRFDPSQERVIYGLPYAHRLPAYHRLDLSISRTFRAAPHLDATLKFDVINAYDRDNLLYLDLFTIERVDQLPRFYSLGLRIDLK